MRIGLTGGMGSGKSTAAARFAELGAVVIDSDLIAREVLAPGTPGLARVVQRFGEGVLGADRSLDRPRLGTIVFADPAALADLNAIVHPLVRHRSDELATAAGEGAVLVHDVPLLVENGMAAGFDAVVVVEAPLELRLERLSGRGMTPDVARSRIAAQATDEQRREVATVVLDNSGSVVQLRARVDAVWPRLLGRTGS
ncbi:dephospho-CoA kinase [Jatrophihabitans lederbergiae]|uniref:Dephospho-CoA kinase n=1 Tax=Jatrophihabitans lederbergiae TaxID=3075547 RepID=A0ABU2JH57_9ACTN|nr:dephospho-CoA kinase [Jatrophihabitans sp. DSM 44399]MDT0264325.1 dephospho-CoA kinase [Jatrophihabitans sp. DSM 44399]